MQWDQGLPFTNIKCSLFQRVLLLFQGNVFMSIFSLNFLNAISCFARHLLQPHITYYLELNHNYYLYGNYGIKIQLTKESNLIMTNPLHESNTFFFFFLIWRQSCYIQPRLSLNSGTFCLSLLGTGIRSVNDHSWQYPDVSKNLQSLKK